MRNEIEELAGLELISFDQEHYSDRKEDYVLFPKHNQDQPGEVVTYKLSPEKLETLRNK
jgi:hypothetical protein